MPENSPKNKSKSVNTDRNSEPNDLDKIELNIERSTGEMASASSTNENENSCFAVIPLNYCPHLEDIKNINYDQNNFDVKKPCIRCKDPKCSENWICLTCEQIYCSRFVKGHMVEHWEEHSHPMVLSFSDITVWCYECDSYVHNGILNQPKQLAYSSKFNK